MNLAIISGWNSGYQCLADVTIPNRELYAAKHGYKTISKCLDNVGGRSGLWAKQWLAIEAIYNFEWIWLWDIDAIVTCHCYKYGIAHYLVKWNC